MDYYPWCRKALFLLDPERAHTLALATLKQLSTLQLIGQKIPAVPRQVMGINFPNPVGLAGGFDRHAEYYPALSKLGFGFVEVGTITPKPQPGNPKPRIFRLESANAVINRIGFYSKGIEYAKNQLANHVHQGILGINVGKNLSTPVERAIDDYLLGMQAFYQYADYLTVNISSPNTPDLRQLQYEEHLSKFLNQLKQCQQRLAEQYGKYVPLVVKIDPDMTSPALKTIAETLLATAIDGVIATNTTLNRTGVTGLAHAEEKGGLSGEPLFPLTLSVVSTLAQHLQGKIPIIALGGIMSASAAKKMLQAGASLVQLYTGFIYQGPRLVKDIVTMIKQEQA